MNYLSKIVFYSLYLLGIFIISAGCTTTYPFVSAYRIPPIKKARIILTDGSTTVRRNVLIGLDSTSCTVKYSPILVCVPQSDVQQIETKDYLSGAGEGFLYGSITGFLLSLIALPLAVKEAKESVNPGLTYATVVVLLTGGGIILGSLIGVASGHTDRYINNNLVSDNKFVVFDISEIVISGLNWVSVSSILEETEYYIIVEWKEMNIKIFRWEFTQIDRQEDAIKIEIWNKVIQEKFHKPFISVPKKRKNENIK
jgi:hypothetical protein